MRIQWASRWFDGHVVAVNGNGTVRVHYDGWSDHADDDVARDDLRLR